jgi:hypothetical protein
MALKTPVQIDGKAWKLFKDYDKPHYSYLSPTGKIEYLEKRVQLILIDPLEEIKQKVLANSTTEYYWLCIITLVCCGIEATGGYLIGRDQRIAFKKGTSPKAFKEFVRRYMPDYNAYVHDLWKFFRNGLAHGFCIQKGGIELNLPNPAQRNTNIGVQINGDEFFDKFKTGFFKYADDLKKANPSSKMRKNFEKAWNWIFIS